MKSDLKDCSCLVPQMRRVRGEVVEGQKAMEAGFGYFSSPIM